MKYNILKETLSKEKLLQLYPTHSDSMICDMFGIKKTYQLVKLLSEYDIQRHTKEENTKITCLYKYGVDSVAKLDVVKDKIKNTNLSKYGYECFLGTECCENLVKDAIKNKYGVDNIFQLDEVKEKSKQTKLEKYGNENFVNVEKRKQTKLEKYGNANFVNIEKRKETLLATYGVPHQMQLDDVKEKVKSTIQKKYGFDYYCLSPDCRSELVHKKNSKPNKKFANLLNSYGIEFEQEFYLDNYYYDFRVGDILIEIDPIATHNSTISIFAGRTPKEKDYHYNKTTSAITNGFRCIHVFDWDNADFIINTFLVTKEQISTDECSVCEISSEDAERFVGENIPAEKFIGFICHNEIVSIMTFGKPRLNESYEYELFGYFSNKDIVGGEEKLFEYFLKTYSPQSIIGHCDLNKFSDSLYEKLGFTFESTAICRHWYNPKTKRHILDDSIFDEVSMIKNGFLELYDAGQSTYIYS